MADAKKKTVLYKRSSAPSVPASLPSYTWQELGKVEMAFQRFYEELDARLKVIEAELGIAQSN